MKTTEEWYREMSLWFGSDDRFRRKEIRRIIGEIQLDALEHSQRIITETFKQSKR